MNLKIKNAHENNLKNIDVSIDDGLTVITGVSGSGKTSLAFDTLHHEARRRFLDCFMTGSRGLRLMPAQVDSITGIRPAIAVGQNLLNRNPNSTLATASGIHPFLRLMFTHFAVRNCTKCSLEINLFPVEQIAHSLIRDSKQHPLTIDIPLVHQIHGSHTTLISHLLQFFPEDIILIDGIPAKSVNPDPGQSHSIVLRIRTRLEKSDVREAKDLIETARSLGATALTINNRGLSKTLSFAPVCPGCGQWVATLQPAHFHHKCHICHGLGCDRCFHTGLCPEAASAKWNSKNFNEVLSLSIEDALGLFTRTAPDKSARRLYFEINRRLKALATVGLGYVSLDRPVPALSRGEAQRVRLAVMLTNRLEDMLYIMDEPTIGLHPVDVERLIPAFRDLEGPVVFVEHDRIAAAGADRVIDVGPGAGPAGGRIVFTGDPAGVWKADTPTGEYFSLRQQVAIPGLRAESKDFLVIRGAFLRNLQNFDAKIPYGRLTVVTGVSGSGKSTFVEDVLVESLLKKKPAGCLTLEGPMLEPVFVDQTPIGRNPRSNPATYTRLADLVRNLFSETTGMSPSHFSFNRPEGACPECGGMGAIEVNMRYLPSSWIRCEACSGLRFSDEVLAARISVNNHQFSIADFYSLPIDTISRMFHNGTEIRQKIRKSALRILSALCDTGLGYLPLGQPSTTLSGGEAQRVKLAKYLSSGGLTGKLLVLDEPGSGLHPSDLGGLLRVLDRLVRDGATVVVVEHNTDIIRSADWIIDLGPGAGPRGGRIMYQGPSAGLWTHEASLTAQALRHEKELVPKSTNGQQPASSDSLIKIKGARIHNLKNISVEFPKNKITVVTGVSGSGKSSLVGNILESEARRRFLEMLSMYERQGVHEGPESGVDSVTGLGVAVAVSSQREKYYRRSTAGSVTGLNVLLSVLLSAAGEYQCLSCGSMMTRSTPLRCNNCGSERSRSEPRYFLPSTYASACLTCHGIGSMQIPNPSKLIVDPQKPLFSGAMYSPGFFPKGYLGEPFNHGYYMVKALAQRYGFDPVETPWMDLKPEAQHAFLFGDPEPMDVVCENRKGRISIQRLKFPGFYGFIRDWDAGGTYTDTTPCPECNGTRLRQEYLKVYLSGKNIHQLDHMPVADLSQLLNSFELPLHADSSTHSALTAARRRTGFLTALGLGYLHLDRVAGTVSAGEAQRIRLAGLLGSDLTSLTVILDEPSRGLHPSEVNALVAELKNLRDDGNTIIIVEHDPEIIRSADFLMEIGPYSGERGGSVVAAGTPEQFFRSDALTAEWISGKRKFPCPKHRMTPNRWMTISGARSNNLKSQTIRIPLGVLCGICGVSGSGKSTLMIDTIGRVLAPRKQTTSVAYEPMVPGDHDAITGAPARTILVDQSRAGMHSPISYLDLVVPFRKIFAASESAALRGMTESHLSAQCETCGGSGINRLDMGFLPDVIEPCESCSGTGFPSEAWEVRVRGVSLPELYRMTIHRVLDVFSDIAQIARPLQAACNTGLGYLVLNQPGLELSGGEAQRLKIARELSKNVPRDTLYILDEPTTGQHLEDVVRLSNVLMTLVHNGGSVIIIEHHPELLAVCDWLIEMGPEGGPAGGWLVAEGTPEDLAAGTTPEARYLRSVLEIDR